MPETLTRWGYLKRISLRLHRNYTYGASSSATCRPLPGRRRTSSQASFKFAFASMLFDDGRTLSSKLTRTCRVKGAP